MRRTRSICRNVFFCFSGNSYPCIWEFLSPTTISINGGKMIICLTQPWALPKLDWNYITVLNIQSVHTAKLTIQLFAEMIILYSYLSQTQTETISNFKHSVTRRIYLNVLKVWMFITPLVHFLFEFPFSQYLSSKFNYKAYNPLI